MLVTLCTFLAIIIMAHKKVRGVVLIGIIGGMGLCYLLSYIVISVFCGDVKKIKAGSWVIAALFVVMLGLTH